MQLGKHVRLPFDTSSTQTIRPFQLIHCDLCTSPLPSVSGYKYYLVVLDDFTHYLWTFPVRAKSNTFLHLNTSLPTSLSNLTQLSNLSSVAMVANLAIKLLTFFSYPSVPPFACLAHIPLLKMVKPNVSFARLITWFAPFFSKIACHQPTGLKLFTLPCSCSTFTLPKTLQYRTPYEALRGLPLPLEHLSVFGCLCYPNLSATAPHKLAPHTPHVFSQVPL